MNSNPRQIPVTRDPPGSEHAKRLLQDTKLIKESNIVNQENVSGLAVREHLLYLNPINGHNATNSNSIHGRDTPTSVESYSPQMVKRNGKVISCVEIPTSQVNFTEMDADFCELSNQMKRFHQNQNQNQSRFCDEYSKEIDNLLFCLRFSPFKRNTEITEMSRLMINLKSHASSSSQVQVPSLNKISSNADNACQKTFTTEPPIFNTILDKTTSTSTLTSSSASAYVPLTQREDLSTPRLSIIQKISSNSEALIGKEDHNKFTEKKRQAPGQLAYDSSKRCKATTSSSTTWSTKDFPLTQQGIAIDTKSSPKKTGTHGSDQVSNVSIPLYLKDVCGKTMQNNASQPFKKPSQNVHFNISMTNINIAPNNLIINERDNKLIESIKQLLLRTNNKFTEEYTIKEKVLRFLLESSEKKSSSYEITLDHLTGQILRYKRVSNGKEISMDYSEDSEAFIMRQLNDVKVDLEGKVDNNL